MSMTPEKLVRMLKNLGSLKAVARYAVPKVSYSIVHRAYVVAVEAGLIEPLALGRKTNQTVKTKQRVKAMRAVSVVGKRFIVTCAQNNTKVHMPTWKNLVALAKHYDAQIMVSQFLYYKNAMGQRRNDKANLTEGQEKTPEAIWYDPVILPHVLNKRVKLASGLQFCGELNISPTAARPLSGLEVYTGRASMIVPHVKIALQSIATVGGGGTKFNYSTGTVTQRNYIQRKEGFKAEFHHCYGGLLVELDDAGGWWVRQLNADSDGTIQDLDVLAVAGVVTTGNRIEAITFGDVHVDVIDKVIQQETWGEGGMVDVLNPKEQHVHDVVDFSRRGHHTAKNHFKKFKRFITKRESVFDELKAVRDFLTGIDRPDCKTVVIESNHDHHLTRWLDEQDGRDDPVNAEFWLRLNSAAYHYIRKTGKEPLMLKLALEMLALPDTKLPTFITSNDSYVICRKFGGGIECSQHGDRGANGARGSLAGFAKVGRRTNIGHSHSAGIQDGAYQQGTKSELLLEYNSGMSSWSHSDIITYPNSKRAIITFHDGKWRA